MGGGGGTVQYRVPVPYSLYLRYSIVGNTVGIGHVYREENIQFVCLPPNSTDKLQPLDVGFFGPMKSAWRKQLKAYADQDPTAKLLVKTEFPRMLKELVEFSLVGTYFLCCELLVLTY